MTSGNKTAWVIAFLFGALPSAYGQTPAKTASPNDALPQVTLNFGSLTGPMDNAEVLNPVVTYGGELTVQAGELHGDLLQQQYRATDMVRVHDADTTLTAQSLQFDGKTNIGVAEGALLTQRPYTVHAQQITITSDTIQATHGSLTTAPPGTKPDLEARFRALSLFPQRHNGILHGVSLYLLHARLVTLPRVSFSFGNSSGSSRRQAVFPSVGVSSRYGPFLSYGGAVAVPFTLHYSVLLPTRQSPQLRLTGQQALLTQRPSATPPSPALNKHDYLGAIHQLAAIPPSPLPAGDPLLFRSYLPEPDNLRPLDGPPRAGLRLNEEVSTHLEASGRRRDDLYVYRLPEVSLNGSLPLTTISAPPVGDPIAFRQSLRRLVLVANASAAYGYFEENPDHLHAARQQDSIGLTSRPLLIATNTLFQPRVIYTTNFYSGRRESYRYVQVGAEVNHYFTTYSAVGIQFLGASTTGDSPFNFDVLDTSRELNVRIQMGNRRLAVAGQVRFDLTNGGIYDYKLAIAPGLNGLTPVFSYNFRSRSIGFGIDIVGLTF